MKIIILKKGEKQYIAPFLPQHEVDCHCNFADCNNTLITQENIDSFTKTRAEFDKPTLATSCFRCQKHNAKPIIDGKKNSSHLIGDGIDLRPLVNSVGELDRLEKIARKHYKFIIRYKNFIHCDNRLSRAPASVFAL